MGQPTACGQKAERLKPAWDSPPLAVIFDSNAASKSGLAKSSTVEEWRAQASRGRYESKMWTSEALVAGAAAPSSSAAAPTAAPSAAGDRPVVLWTET